MQPLRIAADLGHSQTSRNKGACGVIDLRDLQLLEALARHKHFARAAEECGISQPAFSMRMRSLETQLDVTIIRRGNRFQGLTEEGETVLRWARRMLEDERMLQQEVRTAKGVVSGTLQIGVVPTALTVAARLTVSLHKAHPRMLVRIMSAPSLHIQQMLEDGKIDAGITYSDGIPEDLLQKRELYDETYVLLTPNEIARSLPDVVSWKQAASLPLCMLEPQMQNRRILDNHFQSIGERPDVVAETNALTSSLYLVKEGVAATIVPEVQMQAFGALENAKALPLGEPELTKSISLVTARRSGSTPVLRALIKAVDGIF